jgi:hypothetical protein
MQIDCYSWINNAPVKDYAQTHLKCALIVSIDISRKVNASSISDSNVIVENLKWIIHVNDSQEIFRNWHRFRHNLMENTYYIYEYTINKQFIRLHQQLSWQEWSVWPEWNIIQ